MPNDHGPSVKNDKQYEGLRKKGMSKAWAAKIANTPGASKKGGKKSSWLRWTASTIDAAIRPASASQNPEPCTSWPGFSAARPRYASTTVEPWLITPSTSRAIGMFNPYSLANSMITLDALTPSAT